MEEPKRSAIRIFVDADACPVSRKSIAWPSATASKVYVVANAFMACRART